jgi:hypothetical protein
MEARSAALADAGVSVERIDRLESELTEIRGLREPAIAKKPTSARRSRKPQKPSG